MDKVLSQIRRGKPQRRRRQHLTSAPRRSTSSTRPLAPRCSTANPQFQRRQPPLPGPSATTCSGTSAAQLPIFRGNSVQELQFESARRELAAAQGIQARGGRNELDSTLPGEPHDAAGQLPSMKRPLTYPPALSENAFPVSGTRSKMSYLGEKMHFNFSTLQTITKNFADELKIGSGGYGDVYRAEYNGQVIAVKKLYSLQGLDDKAFDNEYLSLCKIDHPNVVRLIGYCHDTQRKFLTHNGLNITAMEKERVLCFEFVEGGSLDKHILEDEPCTLDWPTCYKIIQGTCEGINHLHSAQGKRIYHLDLKPANILLDKKMTAKIADLGLSKLVASTETYKTENLKGTHGYMPPEYINNGAVTKKFDVFSLGVIIIIIMAGNRGYFDHDKMPQKQFIELVTEIWKKRLHGTSRYAQQDLDILRVKTCVQIALKCVEDDRDKRPSMKDIINELEKLEDEIRKISLYDPSNDLAGQTSSDSNVLAVDPSLELRFLFVPRKDISCCLQLTNKTDGYIAYNVKTNQTKYCTKPSKGIMPPCSRRYISVTLRAQEEAPPNMQCHDIFLVYSVNVSEGLTSDDITEDLFNKAMMVKVVDVVKLPIVYVGLDLLE